MILVVGGTGELGRRVVAYLRGRDERVRCLVRPATDDGAMVALGAEVVRGDLTDAATLPPACSGVDTVVSGATAIARRLAGSGPSLRDVDEVGTVALVDAAAAAGVQRFVYVSYAGVDAGLGSPLERAKKAVEQRLRASSMREVLVRPDAFQDVHLAPLGRFDVAAGKVAVIGRGDTPRRWVSTDDVAALVAAVACDRPADETAADAAACRSAGDAPTGQAQRRLGDGLRRRPAPGCSRGPLGRRAVTCAGDLAAVCHRVPSAAGSGGRAGLTRGRRAGA
jgi:uncharacterized protein YbjT (DUF2867 family)